jgi:cytochrome c553
MKKTMIILGTVILAACHTTKVLMESDAERGAKKYPGYTFAQLQQGKADYEKYCGTCHGLKKVSSQRPEQWEAIVPDMARRAEGKAGKEINAAAQESITRYLVTMSTK